MTKRWMRALAAAVWGTSAVWAQAPLATQVDQISQDVLKTMGVPSASVAVVQDGKIAYVQAYGDARLEPKTKATPAMRYSIGSISKQFTSVAILLLAEQGKLKLDDPVAKYVPDVTRAKEVTIRQLLSHTSGYSDYWPQDYVPKSMQEPVKIEKILDEWARRPLDFEPGTKWEYSNTNYVLAGVIVEKIAGQPLFAFLQQHVFGPLGMKSVTDQDQKALTSPDPEGYMKYGLGPLRPSPPEGPGWMFAAGELAMTAEDLAKWDVAMIERKILKPESYKQFETDTLLRNGAAAGYALGLTVRSRDGRRSLEHSGEVSGFVAQNTVYPEDRAAVVVLTNQDASRAAGEIARRIAPLLLAGDDSQERARTEEARKILEGLQHKEIDRSLLTQNCSDYFSPDALEDFASGLEPLGAVQQFTQTSTSLRGGMRLRVFSAKFAKQTLRVWTYEMPNGKLEQYQISVQ